MNNVIEYRKGSDTDIPAFLSFFKSTLPSLFSHYSPNTAHFYVEVDYGPKWLSERLKKGGKKTYLAFHDDEIVGYILVSKSITGVSFADWLGVNKEYQKRGIATQLLQLWEEAALEEGAHALHLWTTENNVAFYIKKGFTNGGLFPKAWNSEDCYLIYKTLRKPEEKNFLREYLAQKKKA